MTCGAAGSRAAAASRTRRVGAGEQCRQRQRAYARFPGDEVFERGRGPPWPARWRGRRRRPAAPRPVGQAWRRSGSGSDRFEVVLPEIDDGRQPGSLSVPDELVDFRNPRDADEQHHLGVAQVLENAAHECRHRDAHAGRPEVVHQTVDTRLRGRREHIGRPVQTGHSSFSPPAAQFSRTCVGREIAVGGRHSVWPGTRPDDEGCKRKNIHT